MIERIYKRVGPLLRIQAVLPFFIAPAAVLLFASFFMPENGPWQAFFIFLQQVAGTILGAYAVGLIYELVAREEMIKEIVGTFGNNKEMARLLSLERRDELLQEILDAHLDDSHGLSLAIGKQVVRPFLKPQRYRTRFHYDIDLGPAPRHGWTLDGLKDQSEAYARLHTICSFTQRFSHDHNALTVILTFEEAYRDLDRAFRSTECIYRDGLRISSSHLNCVLKQLEGLFAKSEARMPEDIFIGLQVGSTEGGEATEPNMLEPSLRFDRDTHSLIATFGGLKIRAGEMRPLKVVVKAPYLISSQRYIVIFGEAALGPRVRFSISACGPEWQVADLCTLQGNPADPRVDLLGNGKTLDFRDPNDRPRWLLPRSGIAFFWEAPPTSPS